MRWKEIACVLLAIGAVVGFGCGSEESAQPDQMVEIITLTGEHRLIESSKICWNTLTPVPEGHVAVARPDLHRVDFVPDGETVDAYEYGGSGSVSCDCTSGTGCDPSYYNGSYACVMKSGCTACTKK
jgi:hypothetical protein